MYADDARLVAYATDVVVGRAEIEAYWRTGLAIGVSRVDLETVEVARAGETGAVEVGRYAVTADDGPGRVVDRGTYVALHRQTVDGAWRRTLDVFDPDGPVAARPV